MQRKDNQFIKELNAQQAEDDGEENSKVIQERVLKKMLMEKSKEKKLRKERKKQAKMQKHKTLTMKRTMVKDEMQIAEEKRREKFRFKLGIRKFLDHYIIVIFMTVITVYALFFEDIRVLSFDKKYDDIFYGITAVGVVLFTIEIMLASYAIPNYPLSFFFYLDIISTLSMIPDCGWIWELIIAQGDFDTGGATDLAKASRAGRVTRVIRVIRLIRLIRIVKLYKQTMIAQRKAQQFQFKQNKGGLMLKGLDIKKPLEIE